MSSGNPYSQMIDAAAQAYNADPGVLTGIAQRESSFNPSSMNGWDSNAKAGHPSGGMFQFIQPTFNAFSRQARAANPAAWSGVGSNWMDPHAQALTTAWAITHGHTGDWTTYNRALADATGTGGGVGSHALPAASSTPAPVGAAGASDPTLQGIFQQSGMNPIVASMLAQGDPAASPTTPSGASHITDSSLGQNVGGSGRVVSEAMSRVGNLAGQAAAYAKAAGQPFDSAWCGDFVQSVFKNAGLPVPPARSVPALLRWAQANGHVSPHGSAGQLALMDWNHDGTPDHVEILTGHGMAVGGNEGGVRGRGVYSKPLPVGNVLAYVNPY